MLDGQVQARLARLLAEVRAVLAERGVTDAGLPAAGELLAVLAAEPWVRAVELAPKHGGASESRVLRSDGPEDLTLTLARFKEERPTADRAPLLRPAGRPRPRPSRPPAGRSARRRA